MKFKNVIELIEKCNEFGISNEKTIELIKRFLLMRIGNIDIVIGHYKCLSKNSSEISKLIENVEIISNDYTYICSIYDEHIFEDVKEFLVRCSFDLKELIDMAPDDFKSMKESEDRSYKLKELIQLHLLTEVFNIGTDYLFREITDLNAAVIEAISRIEKAYSEFGDIGVKKDIFIQAIEGFVH